MRKRLKSAAVRLASRRRLNLFSWRWREAFVALGFISLLGTLPQVSHAVSITGVNLVGTAVNFELGGTPNGTTVQFTISDPGQVEIDIAQVQNVGDTGTRVASLIRTFSVSGSTGVFWDGQWLINGGQGRTNGNYQFTIILTTGTGATPVTAVAQTLAVINSVDIHNVAVNPSVDSAGSPTFPYTIQYSLAKSANVSVSIYNSSQTLVRTLLTNKPQLNEQVVSSYTVTWDGTTIGGTPAPIGVYTSSITALDTTNRGTAFPRVTTFALTSLAGAAEDPKKLFEDSTYVYPNPVRDGQGIFQYRAVRDGATITLRIYTITGTLVLDKNFGSVPTGIVNIFTWNAVNQSGNKVGRGLYFYVMREHDPQGVIEITKKLAVIR